MAETKTYPKSINDGEEDKSDGTADEIYYLESLQEDLTELDDVDDDRNIFDVFDDEVSDDEEEEDIWRTR